MKAKKRKLNRNKIIVALVLLVIIIFIGGLLIGRLSAQINIPKEDKGNLVLVKEIDEKAVSMNIPAVDNNGNGVLTELETKVRPGSGLVLVNINNIIADLDTQLSARTAVEVAKNYTKINLDNIDVIYYINTNATLISGTSAGAAMTISAIAALEGKNLNDNVIITGTIDENGNIGKVGGVPQKIGAAKDKVDTFLIPEGQQYQMGYTRVMECKNLGMIKYCKSSYIPKKINIQGDIKVIEVKNVDEAMEYFII